MSGIVKTGMIHRGHGYFILNYTACVSRRDLDLGQSDAQYVDSHISTNVTMLGGAVEHDRVVNMQ